MSDDTTFDLDILGITEDWISDIYGRLGDMTVELDEDPIRYGPGRLNEKFSQTRAHLSETEGIFLDVSKKLRILTREHRRSQSEFELLKADLMANDPDVRAGRNIADRNSLVSVKLRDKVEHINNVELLIQDLEAIDKVVRSRRTDLRDCQGRIRDQMKLCQEQVSLGEHWGSALPPNKRPVQFQPRSAMTAATADDLDDILRDEETHLGEDDWEKLTEDPGSGKAKDMDALFEEVEAEERAKAAAAPVEEEESAEPAEEDEEAEAAEDEAADSEEAVEEPEDEAADSEEAVEEVETKTDPKKSDLSLDDLFSEMADDEPAEEADPVEVKVETTKTRAPKVTPKVVIPDPVKEEAPEPVETKEEAPAPELPPVDGPKIEEVLSVEGSQDEIDKFLDETSDLNEPRKPVQPDVDLDDLLAGL